MMKLMMFMLALMMIIKMNNFKIYMQNYLFLMLAFFLSMINFPWFYWSNMYYMFGMDLVSASLIILSIWIMSLAMMASNISLHKQHYNLFLNISIILLIILFMCFMSTNLMMFYIMFETSLIPMIFIIMGWGLQVDRIQASMYLLFYTLTGSLPLLTIIMMMIFKHHTLSINLMTMNNTNFSYNFIMFTFIMSAFLIKMPMYLTHLWLPKAHVEAPISGSMILAGIMLKLGSYGLYRLILIFNFMNSKYNFIIITLSMMGTIYASLMCMNQMDMKIIVALSSVVHMNMNLASLLTMNYWSFKSTIWMMISHGLCSSAMFCLVNMSYERIHSRMMTLNKGLINISPSLTMWWFLICSSNFSAPPSLNLISEIFMIKSIMIYSTKITFLIFMTILLSTFYSVFLFSSTQHGPLMLKYNFKNINIREFLTLWLHWTPLNLIFLNISLF